MTAATVVQYDNPVPGFASGTSADYQDGYTVDTGLGGTVAFFALAATGDTVLTVTSQTGGIVTLAGKTAGAGVGAEVITWFAVRKSR